MKNFLLQIVFILCLTFTANAGFFDDTDWVEKSYRDGEPDYADGDLEDKLGDSGYYYDLFPEERDGEPDDHDNNYNGSRGNQRQPELTADFIKNMPDLDTRMYKFEFPDGSTGYGTKTEFNRIMREKYTYGAMQIGDKYYYKNFDGTFKTGWYQEDDEWYYFDLNTCALVTNELRNINGKVYYFKPDGQMAQNEIVEIAGVLVRADENGSCEVVNK